MPSCPAAVVANSTRASTAYLVALMNIHLCAEHLGVQPRSCRLPFTNTESMETKGGSFAAALQGAPHIIISSYWREAYTCRLSNPVRSPLP